MRHHRWVAGGLVALAVIGYGTADAYDALPGVLTLDAQFVPPPRPSPSDPARLPPQPALSSLSAQAPIPAAAGLTSKLGPLLDVPALGSSVSAMVVDAVTGDVLLQRAPDRPRTPASTAKLLTAAAVLTTVGGNTRLPTRVLQGASPDEIVLVGGGDTLLGTGISQEAEVLGHAGLATLAAQVAKALATQDIKHVVVRFDDHLFEGAQVNPAWDPTDLTNGFVGHVTALGLAADHPRVHRPGPAKPSASAAEAFAQALRAQGITVTGDVARTRATAEAKVLGQVESATVGQILALALTTSDNTLTEVLARLAARAMGRAPTFEDAAIAVVDQVAELGVNTEGVHLVDGSGLGHGSTIPARVLADVLALAAGDQLPKLRPMLAGLPISGFTGSLASRYMRDATEDAAGLVRAKTGTLTGVSSLAGYTVDSGGRLLVFVLLADEVPVGGTTLARRATDRFAAALTACGCR